MTGAFGQWLPDRPSTLVIACSDGRLQEATDEFLAHHLEVTRYDRFYVPGGAGALAASGRHYIRAQQIRRECRYLVELHAVRQILLLFHGPTVDGPLAAACADYRRKLPWASVAALRDRQERDAEELHGCRGEWAGGADVSMYRCEVDGRDAIRFEDLIGEATGPIRREPVRRTTQPGVEADALAGPLSHPMAVEIRSESASELSAYAAIPVSFLVTAVMDVARLSDRFTLNERSVTTPYIKDYDAVPANGPLAWAGRFQVAEWAFFSARLNGSWVGAAAVAPDQTLAPGAGQEDAVLWDLRVAPSQRGRGIGGALFSAVEDWARLHDRSSLLMETQQINVAACRLYGSRGCVLERVDSAAYPDFPDEVQLMWRKHLAMNGRGDR